MASTAEELNTAERPNRFRKADESRQSLGSDANSVEPAGWSIDLRPRRDLLSRRFSAEVRRRVFRGSLLLLADAIAVAAALLLGSTAATAVAGHAETDWLARLPLVLVLTVFGQAVMGTYGPVRQGRRVERVIGGLVLTFGAWTIVGLGDGHLAIGFGRAFFLATFLAVALIAGRTVLAMATTALYRRGRGVKNTLIIGPEEESWELVQRFRTAREDEFRVVGHLAVEPERDATALGSLAELSRVLEEHDVRSVVVSARLDAPRLQALVRECFAHGAAVSVIPATLTEITAKVGSRNLLGWPMLELEVPRLHLLQILLKRLVDIIGSAGGILLLSPVYVAIAALIRIDSRGPILFRQQRLGLGGRKFTIYKFRSMRADAEDVLRSDPLLFDEYVSNNYKLPPERDPRVSKLGQFLRRTSLDELPQLFNVLKGDMSLVGPRPIVPKEIDEYGEDALTFLAVKPGVTGWWQISGRSDVGYPQRADLDLNYISGWSLMLDLKILALTVPYVLRGKGAH